MWCGHDGLAFGQKIPTRPVVLASKVVKVKTSALCAVCAPAKVPDTVATHSRTEPLRRKAATAKPAEEKRWSAGEGPPEPSVAKTKSSACNLSSVCHRPGARTSEFGQELNASQESPCCWGSFRDLRRAEGTLPQRLSIHWHSHNKWRSVLALPQRH